MPDLLHTRASDLREVVSAFTIASQDGRRIRPVGTGEWEGAWGLESGPPLAPNRVLSLTGFDKLIEYEPADLTMTVGAGVSLGRIAELTRANKQWLAVDPIADVNATIGATIATASSGALRTGFGALRDHVLGVTLVTGDGRILELGGRVVKNVAGFDLLKLMVGGWGRFGVVTQVTVRLNPLPAQDITLVYESDELGDLAAVARALATAPVVPAALRLDVHRSTARLLARVVGGEASAPVEAQLLKAASNKPTAMDEGVASASLWREQQALAQPDATELSVCFVPSELPAMVPAIKKAREAGWRIRCDVTEGLCAVDGVDASLDGIVSWAAAGAALRILRASSTARERLQSVQPASDPTVRTLIERLTHAFDPAGVLG